ncbi:MAG TPA: ScyD/ScyE family protein [Gaiellaceae bacterium]|nr:ScyD/ScyE family protein [Gaiellaceae bacterium]
MSTVATGLDSPRGLLMTPSGRLLVAEAGHGGDVCGSIPAGQLCIGLSSQISTVEPVDGTHTPLVTGLYSRSVPTQGITGVDGISTDGGRLEGVITSYPEELAGLSCTGQPADCTGVLAAARAQAGRLISFTPGGTFRTLAGVGSYDYQWATTNSGYTTEPPNANPYGIFALPGGAFVADAGANTLDLVLGQRVSILSAFLPPPPGAFPADTVPTCLTVLRGRLYAGSLSGHLWMVHGRSAPTDVPVTDGAGHSLIHHVTGCVSDERTGAIYLVDMWSAPTPPLPTTAGTGSVIEFRRDGTASVIASGLTFPNGITIAKDGSLYITVDSTCTATGSPLPFCAQGGGIIRLHH